MVYNDLLAYDLHTASPTDLLMVLAADVDSVYFHYSVPRLQSCGVRGRLRVHCTNVLTRLALLGVQVEPIAGKVGPLA